VIRSAAERASSLIWSWSERFVLAQIRLHKRYWKLTAAGKDKKKIITAR